MKASGYAAQNATTPLAPFAFERREPGPRDVQLDVLYCGVCHSDLHMVRNEWGMTAYPVVPGHEIAGRVTKVGSEVKGFRPGDPVGVGCLVDSCRICPDCKEGLEQYCQKGFTLTYNSPEPQTGKMTYGGYSTYMVVDQDFVLRMPEKLPLSAAGPLLCAGITTYSPLRHWNTGKGKKVGVVSRNPNEVKKHARSFDFILNTVAVSHNLDPYLELLKRDGTLCLVGAPEHPHPSPSTNLLVFGRRQLAGSLIGGLRETQEMLDFCAQHNVAPEVEMIPIQKINEAYERMLHSDVKYRFVIDMASLNG